MNRQARAWAIFTAALALALAVMLFFTAKMLQLEHSIATAQANAALEETVRLALWRMDSAAAILLAQDKPEKSFPDNRAQVLNAPSQQARNEAPVQTAISQQEFQQRQSLNIVTNELPPASWRSIEPVLLDRIADILPGASLEPAPEVSADEANKDTRRLATIPARLVVPVSAAALIDLPWNTPLRVSLLVAWACVLLAAAAVGGLLSATLSLSQRRGAFASAVTHELRTPLTTFRMYSELLASGVIAEPASRQQYLRTLVSEADRLGHLIENVLAYSRLENRASPRRIETLSADQLFEQALPALRRRVEQAGLPLKLDIADAARGLPCQADPIAVQQILINLVDNACKYGLTEITLSARPAGQWAEFRVSDQGPGLGHNTGRAFTAFNKSRSDAVPGIGLGLYLSRQLARNMGGELVHDPAARGATFILRVPADKPAPKH